MLKLSNNFFSNLPPTLYWLMLLDKQHHEFGPGCFEKKEPGYLKSLFSAFDFMLATIDRPLSPEYLLQLHTQAITHTQYAYKAEAANGVETVIEPFKKGFRHNCGTGFGLIREGGDSNCSTAGLTELTNIATNDTYLTIEARDHNWNHTDLPQGQHLSLSIPATSSETIVERLENTIENYYLKINKMHSEYEKLKTIANCIHELEITHPFYDGNGRTFMLLLLNKLLIQNKLSPCILYCADRFDAFSIEELIDEIKDGQTFFKKTANSTARDERDSLLFLRNNPMIASLTANYITRCLSTCKDINQAAQDKITNTIYDALENMSQPLDQAALDNLTDQLEESLSSSVTTLNPVTVDLALFRKTLISKKLMEQKADLSCFSIVKSQLWSLYINTANNLQTQISSVGK